jgi:lysophospholipase L1-like esterase
MKVLGIVFGLLALGGCVISQTTSKTSGSVLIIGDSVSWGYTKPVETAMPCVSHARNNHNGANARNSTYLLEQLPQYFDDGKQYAVIHFNVGLWDIAHVSTDAKKPFILGDVDKYPITTSPDDYRLNLQAIIDSLRSMQPYAILIFATTTGVPPNSPGRRQEDVDTYNAIAKQVMDENNIPIDDLNSWVEPYPFLHKTGRNMAHFTPDGYQFIAQEVVDTLSEYVTCPTASAGM